MTGAPVGIKASAETEIVIRVCIDIPYCFLRSARGKANERPLSAVCIEIPYCFRRSAWATKGGTVVAHVKKKTAVVAFRGLLRGVAYAPAARLEDRLWYAAPT